MHNKKNRGLKILVLIFCCFFLGFLGYIPVFWTPVFLNEIYFNYSLVIICLFFLPITVLSLFLKSKFRFALPILYLVLIFLSPKLREFSNHFLIKYNSGKEISEFESPFLGYKMELPGSEKYQIMGDAGFVYNNLWLTYDALIYQKNHNYNMKSFGGDMALQKIYNENWWKYYHSD